tara:strand:- start:1165 stop:1368 length:204 start_codon:yes stop_codon:yes gene_type:complete
MNEIFNLCVALLREWATLTGMTYQEINIWIFIIIEPIVFVAVLWWAIKAQRQLSLFRSLMYYPNTKK